MDIYCTLDDGRILELRMGHNFDCDEMIWARRLTTPEKKIYLKLKALGQSDIDIFNNLNRVCQPVPSKEAFV